MKYSDKKNREKKEKKLIRSIISIHNIVLSCTVETC